MGGIMRFRDGLKILRGKIRRQEKREEYDSARSCGTFDQLRLSICR
jgi:hypothetical protein